MNSELQSSGNSPLILHTLIHGQRIIPFDTFDIADNEYLLLKIIKSTDDVIFLKLIVMKGPDIGKTYIIPRDEFETKDIDEIQENLNHYQH